MKSAREKFQNLIKTIIKDRKGPLFIVIDDLDRCSPPNAVRFLESSKHLLGIPQCKYIFAVDDEVLSRAVCGHYRNYAENDQGMIDIDFGRNYLDKLLEVIFEIKEPVDVTALLMSCTGKEHRELSSYVVATTSLTSSKPCRDVLRYLSSAKALFNPRKALRIMYTYHYCVQKMTSAAESNRLFKHNHDYMYVWLFMYCIRSEVPSLDSKDYVFTRLSRTQDGSVNETQYQTILAGLVSDELNQVVAAQDRGKTIMILNDHQHSYLRTLVASKAVDLREGVDVKMEC